MYHKLGRPRRTIKAELISIQEPGCDPVFYRFDNKGTLISINEMPNNSKKLDKSFVNSNQSQSDHFTDYNESFSSDKENFSNNNSYNLEISKKEIDIKCDDLSDINYYLNKKPFPSLLDFDQDPLFISHIQPLLVS